MDNLSTMKSARIWEQVMGTSAASSTYGALPDFLIIGAMKCATTSLLYYLGQHPEIQVSSPKELNFFVAERNWGKGLAWYRSHFQKNIMLRGEASPAYTSYPRYAGVPARIARILPQVKLVYILRDPVKRMVSHFIHRSARGEERRNINEVFGGSDIERYLERSRYGLQLQRYMDHFPLENIKILTTERLERSRVETLQDLFAFLEVTTDFHSKRFFDILHRSEDKVVGTGVKNAIDWAGNTRVGRKIPPHIRRWIRSHINRCAGRQKRVRPKLNTATENHITALLEKDLATLRRLTGKSFSEWRI
jgi:hypothetical protein